MWENKMLKTAKKSRYESILVQLGADGCPKSSEILKGKNNPCLLIFFRLWVETQNTAD